MKALILTLATARLTQLVVDDTITEPLRLAIADKVKDSTPGSFTDQVDTAVNCPACTSVWAGAGVLIAEQTGVGRFLVRALALSQAALALRAMIERVERG